MGFSFTQSDDDALLDKVYAAMETGNTGDARAILAEHADSFTDEVARVRSAVQIDYGIRL